MSSLRLPRRTRSRSSCQVTALLVERREEECSVCKDEFVPNESEVWMAACGHATCNDCYNDPAGRRWRRKCPSCTVRSLRYEQLYRPVILD
jgi:hypothetical protein